MMHRTAAYFEREYRKRYGKACNLSRAESMFIIADAGDVSDHMVLMLMALHSRINDHDEKIARFV